MNDFAYGNFYSLRRFYFPEEDSFTSIVEIAGLYEEIFDCTKAACPKESPSSLERISLKIFKKEFFNNIKSNKNKEYFFN